MIVSAIQLSMLHTEEKICFFKDQFVSALVFIIFVTHVFVGALHVFHTFVSFRLIGSPTKHRFLTILCLQNVGKCAFTRKRGSREEGS